MSSSLRQAAAQTPFAQWLADLSEQRGWTSGRQAAKYLGVNQAALATWLRGDFTPSLASQRRLAERTREPLEKIARLVAESRPVLLAGQVKDSPALSPVIMSALAQQVAEQTTASVVRSIAPMLNRLTPDHFTEDEWLRLVKRQVIERVEDAAMAAGWVDGVGGGQGGRGERAVLWEARVRGTCMEPLIPDGCLVLVERRTADPGETVAVAIGEDVMCKRLAVQDGMRVLVTADGKVVRPDQEGRILGVVRYVPMPRGATDAR